MARRAQEALFLSQVLFQWHFTFSKKTKTKTTKKSPTQTTKKLSKPNKTKVALCWFSFLLFCNAQALLNWEQYSYKESKVMLNKFLNYIKLSSAFKCKLALWQFVFLSEGVALGWAAISTWKPRLTPEDVTILLKPFHQAGSTAVNETIPTHFKWIKGVWKCVFQQLSYQGSSDSEHSSSI